MSSYTPSGSRSLAVSYAQLVIGPPGSGKTTYCQAMKTFLSALGRKVAVVNLDPGNYVLPYECEINIAELISLEEVMDRLSLGPNGSLVYCMEFLEKNILWLHSQLQKFKGHYLLLDCPGQVELYTHHNSVKNISAQLRKWNFKLVAVNLVDSHCCSDPGTFVSVLLTSLSSMVQMELPHINILSKIDLLEKYGKLPFNLEYYADVLDLRFLIERLSDDPLFRKYKKLNKALVGLVEDYSLVSFVPLNIQDNETMMEVVRQVDKANGYVYGQGPGGQDACMAAMMSTAVGADFDFFKTASVKEKYQTSDSK